MEQIEQLIEDYKRRLNTANDMLKETDRIAYPIKYMRIEVKASCYRTFIAELERSKKILDDANDARYRFESYSVHKIKNN